MSFIPRHCPTDIKIVTPMVEKLIAKMEGAAKAMKSKRTAADKAAKSMITDGLGDHIGYRMPRGMDFETLPRSSAG